MDIRKFAVNPTSRLHLRDANNELMYADDAKTLPIAVNLFGPGSKEYSKAKSAQNNRLVNKMKTQGKTNQTPEEITAESAEFLAACTESWENMEYGDCQGNDLSLAVYSDRTIGFISDQVAGHLGSWSNFTKGSSAS
ncbi:MAG: hypothetical protein KF908_05230 [Nitrosomonas sp.]|nr:hypothetical protein [Nitrosomonas sp.]